MTDYEKLHSGEIYDPNNEDIFIETTHEDLTEIVEEKLDELLKTKKESNMQIPKFIKEDIEQIKAGNYISKIDKYFFILSTYSPFLLHFIL